MTPAPKQGKTHKSAGKPAEKRKTGFGYNILIAILLLATALVYAPSLKNGFIVNWDDDGYILNNPTVKALNSENFKKIAQDYHMGNYHPLTTLSYAVEYHFFKDNPRPYHMFNLLLHLANVLLVFWFIRLLTGKYNAALITAALFALHPMHVESVAWISERKDVLYAFFFLLSLTFYVRYTSSKKPLFFVLALTAFALSLLSKSAAVVLPLILLVLDYYKGYKINLRSELLKLPFFALSLLFGIIAIKSQDAQAQHLTPTYTYIQSFFVGFYALGLYLLKFVAPFGLTAFYPHPVLSGSMLPTIYYIAPLAVLASIFALWYFYKEHRVWVSGLLFFLITIVLVLQFFPVGGAVAAERYTYIPYIGLGLIVAGIADFFTNKYPSKKSAFTVILIAVIVLFAGLSYNRTKVWANGISLFDDVIEKQPDAFYAYHSRGIAHYYAGDYVKSLKDYDMATTLNNSYGLTFYNKGLTQLVLKRNEDALASFSRAIELIPDYVQAYNDRAIAYYNLGMSTEAIADYDEAIRLNPSNTSALYNRGISYFRMNNIPQACSDWKQAADAGLEQAQDLFVKYCKPSEN